MSMLDHKLKPEPEPVRRLEVITGTGRRRRFSDDDKTRIIEETLAAGVVVSEVARRHGLTPQQLFGWRREARARAAEPSSPLFVPAMIEAAPLEKAPERDSLRGGAIELEIDGVTVRVGRGAEAKIVTAVIRALKAGA